MALTKENWEAIEAAKSTLRDNGVLAVVLWVEDDLEGLENPDEVNWGVVDDLMTERGWDAIHEMAG